MPNVLKSQKKMFPEHNAHYKRNFDVGYQGLRLNKMTEYRHQYAISFNKDLTTHSGLLEDKEMTKICLHDPNEVHKRTESVVKNKITPKRMSKHEHGLSELYEYPSRDYIQKKVDCRARKEYVRTPNIIKLRPAIAKRYSCNTLPEYNNPNNNGATISKKNGSPIIAKDDSLKIVEDLHSAKTPMKPKTMNESENSQKRRKVIDEERRSRVLRYKKCLDLQMLIKNGKERYEKLTEKKSIDLFNRRNLELEKQEKEMQQDSKALKKYLAEVYEKQIEEHKSAANTLKEGKDEFCSMLEVNRERYFKVL